MTDQDFGTSGTEPVFFPANPEWFHLGSYDAPLVRDLRRLAPLAEWSNPPLGGFGDGGGKSENLQLPQDLVCLQRMGFDNTYEMTGHKLQVANPRNTCRGYLRGGPIWVCTVVDKPTYGHKNTA
jgi:hypothetical protein